MRKLLSTIFCAAVGLTASAQLSTNPDKFLGNITTRYSMNAGGGVPEYYKLWNQVTPENESKWSSVEGSRGNYSWGGADNAFNYAKKYGFTYKFHAFVWGAQYPGWLSSLSIPERYTSYVKWFDEIRKKYSHLPLIDVVNEAIGMHQDGNPMIKESLGGGGKTGYDWLIKAFEMAYERFPNSILIYNDYNSIRWDLDNYITLVQTLRDAGAPIDAYGNQSHDVTDISQSELKNALKKQQDALKMPMYITELDIDIADDNKQKAQYQSIFPSMWEAEYCAGVTLWGYIHGATWVDNSGLYKNGKERPAMTWLKEYIASDKAKTAKSPYKDMKKRVGVYIRPKDFKVAKGDVLPIKVRTFITNDYKTEKADIAIDKVELFDGNTLIATMTEEPYITNYQLPSSATGTRTLKAIVYTNDGNKYERYGRVAVQSGTTKREPYNGTPIELPGTINTGEYDKGLAGVTYNNGVGRNATTATKADGWMEYTVDVKETGIYTFDAEVAASRDGGVFHISEYGFDDLTYYSDFILVPSTGSTTNFKPLHGVLTKELTAGRHTLCLNTDKGGFYIKSISFSPLNEDKTMTSTVKRSATTVTAGDKTTLSVTAASKTSMVASVKVYDNNLLIGTLTEAPYELEFEPITPGKHSITAIVTDTDGKSKTSTAVTLTVNPKREPYSSVIAIPGTIQAENYDKGGEGYSYHDTKPENEGDASFRTDEGVDIVKGNGGRAVGYTAVDEWMEYTVNVAQAGKYTCEAVVSAGGTGSKFTVQRIKGTAKTTLCTIDVPQTGNNDWGTYKSVTKDISTSLTAGEQVFRINITGANCNIDKLIFKLTQDTGINDVESSDSPIGTGFNLSGQKVDNGYRGIIIRGGRKVLKK